MKQNPFQHDWLWINKEALETERQQLRDEGRDIGSVEADFEKLIALGDEQLIAADNQRAAQELLDSCSTLPMVPGYGYEEPSDLDAIRSLRSETWQQPPAVISEQEMKNRIHGAWLGRCCGCFLGKPVEGVKTEKFWKFLKETEQYPLGDYIRFSSFERPLQDTELQKFAESKKEFDSITDHMPVDDDTNYTAAGLLILEKYGHDFSPVDVAKFWMENIPLLSTCTAERIAYRNFSLMICPPASASWRNPYREWIGAQIRADGFAFAAAGQPEWAAEYAWRDASISHVKNGIYGEMFMAAAIAAAPYCDTAEEVLQAGCLQIPATSRLFAAIQEVLQKWREGRSYDDSVADIHSRWDEYSMHHWCHTISNAEVCAVALLYGNGDFGDTLCKAVWPCFDTDCNGATVGSIIGMMLGAESIPAQWQDRIDNTLHTSLAGNNVVNIDEMANRTFRMWQNPDTGRQR
jgi:ADP-ribosylglycohydrolase